MKPVFRFILFLFLLLITSCIAQFVPEINEEKQLLVVQGLITDQPGNNIVRLSKSLPVGLKSAARPLSKCIVTLSDDTGNNVVFSETVSGTYVPPPLFHGVVGRSYTLHINTNTDSNSLNYESFPVELKPVPPIDSIYYEKTVIEQPYDNFRGINGCQIYLDTHDPENNCRYYRWEYSETWALRLNFDVPNHLCWISGNSKNIFIQSTAAISEDLIKRLPVTYISNVTDRLKTKYSISVNQYSMNEDEYNYWDKLQRLIEQTGGLYDLVPSSIPSNLWCVEIPEDKVLGYFSVSAVSSKRIFIKDTFEGIIDPYSDCVSSTLVGGADYIEGLGITVWTLFDTPASPFSSPRFRVFTRTRGCADCTVRGTNIKPLFWEDDK